MAPRPQVQSNKGGVSVDVSQLRALSRDINSTGDKALRTRFRQGLVEGTNQHIVPAAKQNAAFSSRIPGSIRAGVTTRGVYVRAGSADAPHAVTWEGTASGGPRRHPVFATGGRGTWTWVAQNPPKPYLLPALNANADKVAEAVGDAIVKAFGDMGWRG